MSISNIPQSNAKFKLGDRVRLNGRTPALLYKLGFAERRRTRIITKVVYDRELQCTFYYLGSNHRGKANWLASIGFRSYQLVPATDRHRIGRPKRKRAYNLRSKVLDTQLPRAEIDGSPANGCQDTESPLNPIKIECHIGVYDGTESI